MQNARFFIKYKLHHLIFWMLVFAVWHFLRYQDYPNAQKGLAVTVIKVFDLALMIYITNYILVPRLLYKKYYVLFVTSFIIMVFTSSVIKMNILGWVLSNPDEHFRWSGDLKTRIYDNVIPHFFLVMAGAAVKLMWDYGQLQQRMVESARDKAEAELNFLKSQINPHFLFNSLNSVYFLIDKNNNEARSALHKFSEMLRYQLYEMNGDTIPVEKEIAYLQDYVDLQKLRKDDNYEVTFNSSPEAKGFMIPPLLLIAFVENAFKHISHYKGRVNFIKIELARTGDQFYFTIENSKEAMGKINEQQGGIGLNNVKRRLELLYPEKHNLVIYNSADLFKVELRITPDKNS